MSLRSIGRQIALSLYRKHDAAVKGCDVEDLISDKDAEWVLFRDFSIFPGRIELSFQASDREGCNPIWFELDDQVRCSNDAVAYALASIIGKRYQVVAFDLGISSHAKCNIESFTQADVRCSQLKDAFRDRRGDVTLLDFSGGLDSLGALYLVPDRTELVSIDFGGWFERERAFFEKFDPHILRTNFREYGYERTSWTFMSVAAILYAEELNAGYNAFGSIYEAANCNFCSDPILSRQFEEDPSSFMGLKEARYVSGLTEVGTALVAMSGFPDLVVGSLASLAAPGSAKLYRKQTLVEVISGRFAIAIPGLSSLQIESPKTPPKSFGSILADDFLCFYILKHAGIEVAQKLVANIPSEAIEFCEKADLGFYEKLNPCFVSNWFPENDTVGRYLSILADIGIMPYSEKDFLELREVRRILSRYYSFPNNGE